LGVWSVNGRMRSPRPAASNMAGTGVGVAEDGDGGEVRLMSTSLCGTGLASIAHAGDGPVRLAVLNF
jgi:hypothetical protein